MRASNLGLSLVFVVALLSGCPDQGQDPEPFDSGGLPTDVPLGPNPTEGAVILFGEGFDLVNGAGLRLGHGRTAMEQALGAPDRVRDMGPAGVTFAYDELFVTGTLSGPEGNAEVAAIHLHPGFLGQSSGGIGLSSSSVDVETTIGGAVTDPFLSVSFHTSRGVAIDWDGDSMRRLTLLP